MPLKGILCAWPFWFSLPGTTDYNMPRSDYFPGSHIYYNFGHHGHGELKCLPRQSSYKNGVWNTDRATWAVTSLLVDTWFTRKASWPCLTNLQLKRQKAHGSHRAPTLQLQQALCISFLVYNMGVMGRGLLYGGGGSFYFIRFNICFYIHKSNRRQLCEITYTSSTNCLFTAFLSHPSDIKGSYWENIISEFSRNTASVAFLTLVSGLGFSPSGDPTPGASLLRPSQPRQLVSGRRSLDFCRRKKIQHIKALCSSLL